MITTKNKNLINSSHDIFKEFTLTLMLKINHHNIKINTIVFPKTIEIASELIIEESKTQTNKLN